MSSSALRRYLAAVCLTAAAAAFMLGFALGFVLTGRGHCKPVVRASASVGAPVMVSLNFSNDVYRVWSLEVNVTLRCVRLDEPDLVRGVHVYYLAHAGGGEYWFEAYRGNSGLAGYEWWGDRVVLPGGTARIHVGLTVPEDEKPLAVLVVVQLERHGVFYVGPVRVPNVSTAAKPG